MHKVESRRAQRLHIVSSGYADRYILTADHLTLHCQGLRYRLDYRPGSIEAARAYCHLAGLEPTEANLKASTDANQTGPRETTVEYSQQTYGGAIETGLIETSRHHIEAGLAWALEDNRGTALGASKIEALAAELCREEWAAIYSALDAINRRHEREDRPVVTYRRYPAGA